MAKKFLFLPRSASSPLESGQDCGALTDRTEDGSPAALTMLMERPCGEAPSPHGEEGVPAEPSQPHQGPGVRAGLPRALQTRTATGCCHRGLWDPKGTGSVGWGSIKEEIIPEMSSTG